MNTKNPNSRQKRRNDFFKKGKPVANQSWVKTSTYGDYRDYKYADEASEKAVRVQRNAIEHYSAISHTRKNGSKPLSKIKKMIKNVLEMLHILDNDS